MPPSQSGEHSQGPQPDQAAKSAKQWLRIRHNHAPDAIHLRVERPVDKARQQNAVEAQRGVAFKAR